MVRLKGYTCKSIRQTTEFQFQYGAIKGNTVNCVSEGFRNFNSNMVRLKVLKQMILENLYIYFNSNMVRLKAEYPINEDARDDNFNSNMVRLKVLLGSVSNSFLNDFNSNMVRLKERRGVYKAKRCNSISIPIWCD